VDKNSVKLGPDCGYVTMMFATSYLDWNKWSVEGIPAVGTVNLERFWGRQPMHIVVYDEVPNSTRRRLFLEVRLALEQDTGARRPRPSAIDTSGKVGAGCGDRALEVGSCARSCSPWPNLLSSMCLTRPQEKQQAFADSILPRKSDGKSDGDESTEVGSCTSETSSPLSSPSDAEIADRDVSSGLSKITSQESRRMLYFGALGLLGCVVANLALVPQ